MPGNPRRKSSRSDDGASFKRAKQVINNFNFVAPGGSSLQFLFASDNSSKSDGRERRTKKEGRRKKDNERRTKKEGDNALPCQNVYPESGNQPSVLFEAKKGT